MRRRSIHATFAGLALAAAVVTGIHALRLGQAMRLEAAVRSARQAPVLAAAGPADPATPREARLARALALAQAGAYEAAFKSYAALLPTEGAPDPLAQQALFNLANMVLRQGLAQSAAGPGGGDALPLLELAKQRYRDLLRAEPGHWDARHNLERALRLAPEEEAPLAEGPDGPVERRQVMLRGMDAGDLP
jgi:mxaK protein